MSLVYFVTVGECDIHYLNKPVTTWMQSHQFLLKLDSIVVTIITIAITIIQMLTNDVKEVQATIAIIIITILPSQSSPILRKGWGLTKKSLHFLASSNNCKSDQFDPFTSSLSSPDTPRHLILAIFPPQNQEVCFGRGEFDAQHQCIIKSFPEVWCKPGRTAGCI